MAAKPRLIIQAQRLVPDAGYVSCPEHQAQRWVLASLVFNKKISVTRTISKHDTKPEAVAALDRALTLASKPRRNVPSTPGTRWNRDATSPAPIVRGIGRGEVSLFKVTKP